MVQAMLLHRRHQGRCTGGVRHTWGLPSCSVAVVKSRMSSTIWKASPRCRPYSNMAFFTCRA